jgi:glycosyltransferase involved in cell wall biosynthesis
MPQGNELYLSLGLLAHNEERIIGETLNSLFRQSLFGEEGRRRVNIAHLELLCVPNGCTDRTEDVVSTIFQSRPVSAWTSLKVTSCPVPGKAQAWNSYIHELSDPRADYLILLDADITFASEDVLEKLIINLEDGPSALVSTDIPIKRIKLKHGPLSMMDRASLSASALSRKKNSISGQLYCGRAAELRRIWMPMALPVEDGFLAAMIYTDGFTVAQRPDAITEVADAFHYYDTHEDIRGFLRHERRIVVGSVINAWIFSVLWSKGSDGHVGRYIEQQNLSDPGWLDDLIAREVAKRGMWVVPSGFIFKRLRALKGKTPFTFLKRLPIALIATALQLIACVQANKTLRASRSSHFW